MATESPELSASERPSNPLMSFLRGWDRIWFSPADPTTLGVIRICCGLIVLYVHLCYTGDLQELFGKHAWVDEQTVTYLRKDAEIYTPPDTWTDRATVFTRGSPGVSIWYHVTEPHWMLAVHILLLGIMFLFTIGFCTRITSILTWVAALSYIQRAPSTLFGIDTMMMILLLYLTIGPSGATLSVDRLISRWWAVRRARRRGQPLPVWPAPAPSVTANFALRLIQVHFCLIYLASGTSKLQGAAWWNGTAMWGTVANYEFAPLNYARFEDLLRLLCQHRPLWELLMTGGTVFTLGLEIGLPFLIWYRQLRWPMILGAVLLHFGIAMTMGLTTFSLMMLTMVFAFVPGPTVRWWLEQAADPLRRSLGRLGNRVASRWGQKQQLAASPAQGVTTGA